MKRQAIVEYEDAWPWPGKPWPWCPKSEFVDVELVFHPAIPHDTHPVSEGNFWCPGVPGEVEIDGTD